MSEQNNMLNNGGQDEVQKVEVISDGDLAPVEEKPADAVTETAVPEEPLKKKSKAPVIIGCVAVAAAVVAAAAVTFGLFSPKKMVEKALVNTGMAVTARESVFKKIASPGIKTMLSEGGYTLDQSITLDNTPGAGDLKGLGADITMNVDNASKQADLSIKGNYKGINMDVINIYTDNEVLLFNLPALCGETFSVSTDDILGQIKNSPVFSDYAEGMQTDETFSLRVFDKAAADSGAEELASVLKENFEELKASAEYGRTDAKEVALSDGTAMCKAYTVSIPSEAATRFLSDSLTDISQNKSFKEHLNEMAETRYIVEGYSTPDEYISDVEAALKEVAEKTKIGDIKAVFYVNNGIIADSEITFDADYDGNSTGFTVTGGMDTDSSLDITLKIKNANDDVLTFNYNDSVNTDTGVKEAYKLSYNDGDNNSSELRFESNYDSITGDIAAVLGVEDNEEKTVFDMAGTLAADDSSLDLDIYDLSFIVNDETQGSIDYSLKLKALEGTVEKPEGEPVRILEIGQDEFKNIYSEIQSGLYGLMAQLS